MADGKLGRRLVKNTGLLAGGKSLGGIFGLGYLAIAAQALGPADFGKVILVHAYAIAFCELCGFKSWQSIIRYGAPDLKDGETGKLKDLIAFTLTLDIAASFIGAVFAIGLAWLLAPLVGLGADMGPTLAVFSTYVLFHAVTTPMGILRLFDRFDAIAVSGLVNPFLRLVGTAVFWVIGAPLWAYLVLWYVAGLCGNLSLIWFGYSELKRHGLVGSIMSYRPRFHTSHSEIWRFSIAANFHSTVKSAASHLAVLMVGGVLGPAAASLFKVAYELRKGTDLISAALYPEMAKMLAVHGRAALSDLVRKTVFYAVPVALLAVAIAHFAGPYILEFLFGAEFRPAAPTFVWLTLASAIVAVSLGYETALYALGKPVGPTITLTVFTLLQFALMLVFMQRWELVGAGIAVALTSAMNLIAYAALTWRALPAQKAG